jgi:predicted alpha/beta superfamily hydrolase
MFDGQNVFHDETSFVGAWRLHQVIDRLGRARPVPIVAAVDHGGSARLAELSAWPVRGGEGRAEAFVGWLTRDLVADLRRRYAIVPGPAGVALGGSSLGGLAALYGHARFPEIVGGALAFSPSLWVGGGAAIRFFADAPRPWTSRIYLDAGDREPTAMGAHARTLGGILRERGYDDGSLLVRSDPKGRHDEASWRRRASSALRFMYRPG